MGCGQTAFRRGRAVAEESASCGARCAAVFGAARASLSREGRGGGAPGEGVVRGLGMRVALSICMNMRERGGVAGLGAPDTGSAPVRGGATGSKY